MLLMYYYDNYVIVVGTDKWYYYKQAVGNTGTFGLYFGQHEFKNFTTFYAFVYGGVCS